MSQRTGISLCLNSDPAPPIVTLADAEIRHHPFLASPCSWHSSPALLLADIERTAFGIEVRQDQGVAELFIPRAWLLKIND
jgi:hypothetical protein